MRRFYMERVRDESGISGTGKVLEGCVTSSGKCFVEWLGDVPSDCIYPSFNSFKKVHVDSHPHTAVIVWLDTQELRLEELMSEVSKLKEKLELAIAFGLVKPAPTGKGFHGTCHSSKHKTDSGYCVDCMP